MRSNPTLDEILKDHPDLARDVASCLVRFTDRDVWDGEHRLTDAKTFQRRVLAIRSAAVRLRDAIESLERLEPGAHAAICGNVSAHAGATPEDVLGDLITEIDHGLPASVPRRGPRRDGAVRTLVYEIAETLDRNGIRVTRYRYGIPALVIRAAVEKATGKRPSREAALAWLREASAHVAHGTKLGKTLPN